MTSPPTSHHAGLALVAAVVVVAHCRTIDHDHCVDRSDVLDCGDDRADVDDAAAADADVAGVAEADDAAAAVDLLQRV